MSSREQGSFDPAQEAIEKIGTEPVNLEQKELSPKNLQARFDALCVKLGIDPKMEVNFGDVHYMLKSAYPDSKEWLQVKFDGVRGLVDEAILLYEDEDAIHAADEALKSWENYDPSKPRPVIERKS